MIEFSIEDVCKDPAGIDLAERHHLLINIEGTLVVFINGSLCFSNSVCIVELAQALKEWSKELHRTDFRCDSIDEEDQDIFNISITQEGMYRFSSSWQEREVGDVFGEVQVARFIGAYIGEVKVKVREAFNVDLSSSLGL